MLLAAGAVHAHLPDFALTEEGDGFVVEPLGIGLVVSLGGELLLLSTVGVHHPEHLMTGILFDAVVARLEAMQKQAEELQKQRMNQQKK